MTMLGSAVVNGAILSATLSFAVWLALRSAPRQALNAATRYAIWWIVLLITIALPLSLTKTSPAALGTVVGQAILSPASAAPAAPSNPCVTDYAANVCEKSPITAVKRGITLPIEIPASPWLRPILNLWIATSLLLLARVFISYAALYRRSARAIDAPPELAATITGAIRRRIRLAVSAEIAIPIAAGPLRPTILIPSTLLAMSQDDLEQIALHEAAHLARRDDYALFAQRVIETLFALHPVVRWLTRQIDLEREIACDDIVVGSAQHARTYADCLTRTVALCGGVRTSLAAANVADSRSHLSRRIELLVDRSRSVTTRLPRHQIALIAVILVCAAGLLAKTPPLVAVSVPRFAASTQTAPQPLLLAQAAGASPAPEPEQSTYEQHRILGIKQMQDHHYDDAIATFRRIMPEAPDSRAQGNLWANLSQAYSSKGDIAGGIQAMEHAVALLPDNATAAITLALLYQKAHDNAHAVQYYEKAIAIDPNNPLVLNNLAYLLTETGGDLDQALIYARTAQEKLPTFLEVDDTIGWIYLKKNMPAIAVAEFRKLIDARPENPEFRYHYALALYQQGDLADALIECRSALKNEPDEKTGANIHSLIDKLAPIIDTPMDLYLK
jgi:beta-lactamase regulating signal transducer with metallopeptidase domain/Tfp pilus assembly protein PilF